MSYGGVPYLQTPAVICNQSLDLIGQPEKALGDLTDGTVIAECARRNYGQGLRQLLRTAHWDWARRRAPLTLLGDATGNSAPPISSIVECPWSYAYAWPIDAVQGRWLPYNPANSQPVGPTGIPMTTGTSTLVPYPMIPGRFLVSSSDQYPIEVGTLPWSQLPDLQRTEGVGPVNRKIILTDCPCAEFVYTRLGTIIEEWDDLFRQAFVTMMALVLAPVAITDPKLRTAEIDRLRPVLKNAVADARVANGNEQGMPQSTDHQPLWISARGGWGWGNGMGDIGTTGWYFYPYDSALSWCGSVF